MRKLIFLGSLVGVVAVMALTAAPGLGKVAGRNGRIAFARYDPVVGGTFTYTANPDGTDVKPLLSGYSSSLPRWSPDGSEVAVGSSLGAPCCTFPNSAVIVNPDTGSYRTLPIQDPSVDTSCQIWSPDASHLACEGGNDSNPSVNGIYTIRSSDGGGLTRITNAGGMHDVPIDYSPDGRQIVFGRDGQNHNCTTTSALYVVNLDGSGLRRITPWGYCDDDGSWSPDGTKIAFATSSGLILVVHPDGTGLKQIHLAISNAIGAGDVSWSPDGKKIAFLLATHNRSGTRREGIYTANADGSNVQQVTSSPSGDSQTDWGPHPVSLAGAGGAKPSCRLKPNGSRVTAPARLNAAKHRSRTGVVKLTAVCRHPAKLKLTGAITTITTRTNRASRTFKIAPLTASAPATTRVTLTAVLPAAAVQALEKGAKESATFTLTATNANGTSTVNTKIALLKPATPSGRTAASRPPTDAINDRLKAPLGNAPDGLPPKGERQ